MDVKPILFPFTWLPEPHLAAVLRHFSRPVVLAPSDRDLAPSLAEWHASGRIDLQTPLRGDGDRLSGMLNDYRRWADAHRGADLSLARILEGNIPFFDDSHVARIRSEIRKGGSGAAAALDRLTRARLFLQMAAHYDRQRLELETDLEAFRTMETAMFSGLRDAEPEGEAFPAAGSTAAEDPGRFMVEERLRAWAQLYRAAGPEEGASPVFVTTSRAAVETLLDAASGPGKWTEVHVSGGVEAAGAAVAAMAAGKTVPPPPSEEGGEPLLSLFFVPDAGPRRLFDRFRGAENAAGVEPGGPGGTALAWVKITF